MRRAMSEMNGNSFHIGQLAGELRHHMRAQTDAANRNTDILIDIHTAILTQSKVTGTEGSASGYSLPEITAALKVAGLVAFLSIALLKKALWPDAHFLQQALDIASKLLGAES